MLLENYLGMDVSQLISDEPFRKWRFEKSFEDELDSPIFHYVFPRNGFELRCDQNGRIDVIFVFVDRFDKAYEELVGVSFTCNRHQILSKFGQPSMSGESRVHPVLGEYGAWDRFDCKGHSVRIEYNTQTEQISKVTFMRQDAVP